MLPSYCAPGRRPRSGRFPAHALGEAVDEHAGDARTIPGPPVSFSTMEARRQRLCPAISAAGPARDLPRLVQRALHRRDARGRARRGRCRRGCTGRFRQEAPFRCWPAKPSVRFISRRHRGAAVSLPERLGSGQRGAQVADVPAFHDREAVADDLAVAHAQQQVARRGARAERVLADLKVAGGAELGASSRHSTSCAGDSPTACSLPSTLAKESPRDDDAGIGQRWRAARRENRRSGRTMYGAPTNNADSERHPSKRDLRLRLKAGSRRRTDYGGATGH